MSFLVKKFKFLILVVGISLCSIEANAAWSCRVLETPLSLDANYVKGLEALGNIISEPVINRANLRQARPSTIRTTVDRCVEVNIINNQGTELRVILSMQDLSLQGFITKDNIYWFFGNSFFRNMEGTSARELPFNRDYRADLKARGMPISLANLNTTVDHLSAFDGTPTMQTRQGLARVIFITSESLRFRSVSDISVRMLRGDVNEVRWDAYSKSISNWIKLSNRALRNGVAVPSNPQLAIGTINDVQIARRK
ncbi:MAG: ribosome-inactivating family protein [Alphaproteobacteria bacterium]|nr:ribosome-inactivating family protein [Alphaproteobacteria bacterium]